LEDSKEGGRGSDLRRALEKKDHETHRGELKKKISGMLLGMLGDIKGSEKLKQLIVKVKK